MPSSLDNVEPSVLTAVLDGRWAALRGDVRTQLAGADVRDRSDLSTEEYRRQVLEDLRLLAKTEHSRLAFAREYGGLDDPAGVGGRPRDARVRRPVAAWSRPASSGACSAARCSCSAPSGHHGGTCATSSTCRCPGASR